MKRGAIPRQVLTYTFPLQSPPSRINLNSHSDDIWNMDEKHLLLVSAAFISLSWWNQKQQQHKDPGIWIVQSVWLKHKQNQDTNCRVYQLSSQIFYKQWNTQLVFTRNKVFSQAREKHMLVTLDTEQMNLLSHLR